MCGRGGRALPTGLSTLPPLPGEVDMTRLEPALPSCRRAGPPGVRGEMGDVGARLGCAVCTSRPRSSCTVPCRLATSCADASAAPCAARSSSRRLCTRLRRASRSAPAVLAALVASASLAPRSAATVEAAAAEPWAAAASASSFRSEAIVALSSSLRACRLAW